MSKKQKTEHDVAESSASFEFHLKQLEQVVQKLEMGQLDLTESLKAFESGLTHLRQCHRKLSEAEERISLVMKIDPDGTAHLRDLEMTAQDRSADDDASPSRGKKRNAKPPPNEQRPDQLF